MSTQLHEEMHAIKIIVLLEHEFWFHAVDFISGLTATKFLVRLNHESMNFETFSGIFFFFSWIPCHVALNPEECEMGGNFRLHNELNLLCRV